MDDLISRKALLNDMCEDREEGTFEFTDEQAEAADKIIRYIIDRIQAQPSVPAVPLDKLCEWLEGAEKEGLCCLDCADLLRSKSFVTKWMERLDGSESMVQKT